MNKHTKRYFGTDGIRGIVGTSPITPDFMLKLGWAAGKVFSEAGDLSAKILIGKDTRISGYMFEAALEAGISAAGVDINLTGPMPTPAIAYLTRTLRAQAGIVISASHNSFKDNGIKFFSSDGTKLPDEQELAIEKLLEGDVPISTVAPQSLGKASRITDAAGRYIEFCKSTVGTSLKLGGVKVVVDCAHGSTYHIAPSVFEELGASVHAIGVSPDGLNINEKSGSTNPNLLAETVIKEKADLLEIDRKFLSRSLNEGFSGGEKKRNEIFQLAMLEPKLAILDETDSGLDIDALKVVANGVNKLKSKDNAVIVITHYQRLLDYIVPDYVHVLMGGKIVKSGNKELAKELEAKGYDWIKEELV